MQELRHGELGAHGDDVAFLAVVAAAPAGVSLQVRSDRIHSCLLGPQYRHPGLLVANRPDERDTLGSAECDVEGNHRLSRPSALQQVSATVRVATLQQRLQLIARDVAVQTGARRDLEREVKVRW